MSGATIASEGPNPSMRCQYNGVGCSKRIAIKFPQIRSYRRYRGSRNGASPPDGAVITVVHYAAVSMTSPTNGATGSGNSEDVRNGGWEYRAFRAGKSHDPMPIWPPASTATKRWRARICSRAATAQRNAGCGPMRNRQWSCPMAPQWVSIASVEGSTRTSKSR
jgi:hypothetical protein